MIARDRRGWAWLAGMWMIGCGAEASRSPAPPAPRGATLPGGATLEVALDAPVPGAVPAGPLTVSGRVELGLAPTTVDTAVVYVIDLSGSTLDPAGTCGADANGDGLLDTVLDCEVASIAALDDLAAKQPDVVSMSLVAFGAGATIVDFDPDTDPTRVATRRPPGDAALDAVLASARVGEIGVPDLVWVGRTTNYAAAVQAALAALDGVTAARRVVVFVSDGNPAQGGPIAPVLASVPEGVRFFTFAVSEKASCTPPFDVKGQGTLQQIADATGGRCVQVTETARLPFELPSVIAPRLLDVTLLVDGAPVTIEPAPAPPIDGPIGVSFSVDVTLSPGPHELCVLARARDADEEVTEQHCVSVTAVDAGNQPPEVACANRVVSAGAGCVAPADVRGSVSDPDGDPTTCSAAPAGPYGLGVTAVEVTCRDDDGAQASCAATVTVVDDVPPVVTAPAMGATLWPPNHKYRDVRLADCVTAVNDACGGTLDVNGVGQIVRITSDEGEKVDGSGDSCVDAVIAGPSTARLRAERAGGGDGRVYTIVFTVADLAGNAREASCRVQVWHDQGGGSSASDSGCRFCVGSGCGACPGPAPGCK